MYLRKINPHNSFHFGQTTVRPLNQIQNVKPILNGVRPPLQPSEVKAQARRGLERAKM
jgi:hypothetical protein